MQLAGGEDQQIPNDTAAQLAGRIHPPLVLGGHGISELSCRAPDGQQAGQFAIAVPRQPSQVSVEQVCGYILDGPAMGRRRGGPLIGGQLVKRSEQVTALRAEQSGGRK